LPLTSSFNVPAAPDGTISVGPANFAEKPTKFATKYGKA
jgi:hypothetical protein